MSHKITLVTLSVVQYMLWPGTERGSAGCRWIGPGRCRTLSGTVDPERLTGPSLGEPAANQGGGRSPCWRASSHQRGALRVAQRERLIVQAHVLERERRLLP